MTEERDGPSRSPGGVAPPPPVVPVADAAAARRAADEATAALEATMRRAALFDEQDRQRGVNGEWSTVQSLRHVVLVVDVWLSKTILGHADPFHPIALPPSFMPPKLPGSSIDPDARPSFAEARVVVDERLAALRDYVGMLDADELARPVPGHAATVAGALGVLFQELTAHDRFINRDLAIIEHEG